MRVARIAHPGGTDYAVVSADGLQLIEDPFATGAGAHRFPAPPAAEAPRLVDPADARLLAPCAPRTVVGMAHNTGTADRELAPQAFLKPARSVIGPDEAILIPNGIGRVDGEAELAVVIGGDGQVFGYTLANDVTARRLQGSDPLWTQAKGYPSFTPLGPWIETELDAVAVELTMIINGRELAGASNAGLARGVDEVLSYLHSFLPLGPGDVVLVGAPGEYGELRPGDTVEIRGAGLGVLSNPVVSATAGRLPETSTTVDPPAAPHPSNTPEGVAS
jgi:2-keto-4-pentenoate hydratase/2-oxohepta-3-ene-1,7-dioic acid hydratase in catechol pathway